VQFERCERSPDGTTCGCCTLPGDPCAAATVCCSGDLCDSGSGTCPFPSTTTSPTSTSSTTSTTAPACVPPSGACTVDADCCNSPPYFCNTSGGPGTGFCDVLQ